MSRDPSVAAPAPGPARKPLWRVLQEFALDRLESKVFRVAFVTVLVIAAVQQFAGWKYTGLVMREITAVVQTAALPWSLDKGPPNGFNAQRRSVVSLVIGDEMFASTELFKHRVPLHPDALLSLLEATRAAMDPDAWIVIDFDIAPRVDDAADQEAAHEKLNEWLAKHAARLVLLEPVWAVRHKETFERQVKWARLRCGLDQHGLPTTHKAAVLAQPTIATRFGFVQDTIDPLGARPPMWDLGRAVADHLAPTGHKRNPLCDRLPTPAPPGGASPEMAPQLGALKAAWLAEELKVPGALAIAPQPMAALARHGDVVLRHDLLRMRDVEPASLAEVAASPLLKTARVVLVGGSWRFGFADLHDTFVGELDGVRVHAAWIRSWLQPLAHLNKAIDILLDVVVIEALLHPILEFAFVAIRRRAQQHEQGSAANPRRAGPGRHVVWAIVWLAFAALAVAATAFTLIVIDGVLRWCLNRALSIDTTLLALLTWILVVLYRIASGAVKHPFETLAERARISTGWLAFTLAASCGVVWWVDALAPAHEAIARASAWGLVLLLPLGYVVSSTRRSMLASERLSHETDDARSRELTPRARWRRLKRRTFRGWSSNLRALGYALATLPRLHRDRWRGADGIAARWADGLGALVWCAVWGFAIYLLFRSTLWSMFVVQMLGIFS